MFAFFSLNSVRIASRSLSKVKQSITTVIKINVINIKKWPVRKVITVSAALDAAFSDCKLFTARPEKKSLHFSAGSFASPNDGFLPSKKQPYKNPDLVFKAGCSAVGPFFYFTGAAWQR